jgi:organic hydroperoxide reductase OsmC/OhrA
MLWFLHLACNRKFKVTGYHDEAVGVLEKRADGKEAITRVTLRPAVSFDGAAADARAARAAARKGARALLHREFRQ